MTSVAQAELAANELERCRIQQAPYLIRFRVDHDVAEQVQIGGLL
jgi:hypothetical protein